MTKLLLADDHPVFVEGLESLLRKHNYDIVGTARNGEEVIKTLSKQPDTDLVVLDIEMDKLDGVETSQIIKKDFPNTKILIVSFYNQKYLTLNCSKWALSGYVLKNKSSESVVKAIEHITDAKNNVPFCFHGTMG